MPTSRRSRPAPRIGPGALWLARRAGTPR
jgi:hypothetical protein